MIESIFNFILELIFKIITTIITLVLSPVFLLVKAIFPDLSSYIQNIYNLLQQTVPFLGFIRTFIIYVTRVNPAIINIFLTIFSARLLAKPAIYIYIKIKKLFALIKGGKE